MGGDPDACRTALWCLSAVLRHHGLDIGAEKLRADYALHGEQVQGALMLRMARESGLRARAVNVGGAGLSRLGAAFPALARLENGNWVVVLGSGDDGVEVFDPLADGGGPLNVPLDRFCASWNGELVLAKRSYALGDPDQPFSLRWFLPEILRQRRLLLDVAVVVLVLYGLGLASPIFFQLVIDKVLVHESYSTLYMLCIGVCGALLFDAAFVFLRHYLLIFATNKIDIRVATRTFRHLLNLPIAFFENGSAGVLVKHMQQASNIREFMTGRLFLTMLDAMSLFVFVPVLFFYSAKLASIVILFSLFTALTVAIMVGPFRRRLGALYETEGRRQSLLVESIHGMRTVKSLAMEPLQRRIWDDRSAQAITARFEVEKISTVAQAVTGLMEKLMTVAIIGLGALLVFSGDMTIGALVAFNMLAGRVSGPLTQIVTMVHEYQEVSLSVRMLGEVMNQPAERTGRTAGLRPPIAGAIEFRDVTFAYRPDLPLALNKVSFTIDEGSIFGVVGRSGSGKTTVTRLIQGLYQVQQGIVSIGGHDLRELDLGHLRQNVGVVLQDNFLFRGTVRDNIVAARPASTFDEVVAAARLAGAEEFIQQLPRGYDTMIEENGANLSGGQKQRLSIARALIADPRILIFDEATSALDPESEAIVRDSIREIGRGRTVIIVSHRLSTLADANAIMVIDKGQLADMGPHDQLMTRCTTYRQLWNQQMRMAG